MKASRARRARPDVGCGDHTARACMHRGMQLNAVCKAPAERGLLLQQPLGTAIRAPKPCRLYGPAVTHPGHRDPVQWRGPRSSPTATNHHQQSSGRWRRRASRSGEQVLQESSYWAQEECLLYGDPPFRQSSAPRQRPDSPHGRYGASVCLSACGPRASGHGCPPAFRQVS